MTSFFLSHYQATGNDACKLLAMAIEDEGHIAWYDQDADAITPRAMLAGVANTVQYVLLLSEGALQRPFVVFELAVATILQKPVAFLHTSGVVDCREGRHFLRPQDMQPGTKSIIWSDELLTGLWEQPALRRMIMRHVMDEHGPSLVVSLRAPLKRWASLFDGLMRLHDIRDAEGKPMTTKSISMSLGSVLQLTYEISVEEARVKFDKVVRQMDGHFQSGFTSTLLEVTSTARCAEQLVCGLPSPDPPRTVVDAVARSIFAMQHNASKKVSALDRQAQASRQRRSGVILVLGSEETAWQRGIMQQLLHKQGFNVVGRSQLGGGEAHGAVPVAPRKKSYISTSQLIAGVAALEDSVQSREDIGVILWFLSDGFLRDGDACAAAERVAQLGNRVEHVLVHENDGRKPRFNFDWSTQFQPLADRDHGLARRLQTTLGSVESVSFERRSFFQKAMLEMIHCRIVELLSQTERWGKMRTTGGSSRLAEEDGDWKRPSWSHGSDQNSRSRDRVEPIEPIEDLEEPIEDPEEPQTN